MRNRDLQTGLLFLSFVLMIPMEDLAMDRTVQTGARAAALACAVVAVPGTFAVFHNQALLTGEHFPGVGLSFSNPFFISGYFENSLSLVFPLHAEVVAVGLSQTGIAGYRESTLGFSLAKKLTDKISAAIHFNYFDLNLPETGRHKGSCQADAGLGFQVSGRLLLGLHVHNLAATTIETLNDHLAFPTIVRVGASCQLSERILLTGETIYEKKCGTGFRFGTEYWLQKCFWIRTGLATNPFLHSVGFGYQFKEFMVDFALVHHEYLGFSPVFSLSMNFR